MLTLCLFTALAAAPGPPKEPVRLWPGVAPGEKGNIGTEHDTTPKGPDGKPNDNIIRIGDVSVPTLTVCKPPKSKDTGVAVIVAPGGGYYILAWDLEGTEICSWLNSIGITGILLKYRVPSNRDSGRQAAPLQDARRAVRLCRLNAKAWRIDPKRIGMLGFSAGGHLSALAASAVKEAEHGLMDEVDRMDGRPTFTILVYPYLPTEPKGSAVLSPEMPVDKDTPPSFVAMTQDDPIGVEGAIAYASALRKAGVSCELRIYPTGGHGYGMRPSSHAVTTWPARAADWLKAQGWLRKWGHSTFSRTKADDSPRRRGAKK
jgi:acetyl esterase/lipase